MVLPLIPILIAAGAAIFATGTGVAISNWTSQPETVINQPTAPVYTDDDAGGQSTGIGISTNTLLIAGGVILAMYMLNKK